MPNDDYPFDYGNAPTDGYLPADKTVVNNSYAVPQRDNANANSCGSPYQQGASPYGSPFQQSANPYGSPYQQGANSASPGSTAPQPRIGQDTPTVQMRRPAAPRQNPSTEPVAYPQRGQQPAVYPATPYDPDTYDPSPAKPDRQARQTPRRNASQQPATAQSRRGASAFRWIMRLFCLGLLVFGAMTIYYLTEQSAADTSALSSGAGSFAEYGAYLVQSGQLPTFEENPIKWTAAHILLLSVKFSNHGLSIRQQAHVVEFAIMGGVAALNALAWMSGWAHRRSPRGRIRMWRTWFMYALTAVGCAAVSFTDQYHKLYVPGRHFDKLDLLLDASGYIPAITCVFIVWSVGSAIYRLIFRK